ncbi:hypothetical protein MMC08_006013 [Hypocenomyce scalaris]|nr:hypothetical protein [Hypocenomyce scalaris]
MGLKVLAPAGKAPADKAEALRVDIVAVHGLSGDLTKTWTHPTTKAFWLQDFLPQDVPAARVMTFGYNADAAFGNTAADIADHALSMLSSLVDKREEEDVGRLGWASNSSAEANILEQEMQRPIIFIAHSLGGIIVKQNIYGRTVGIIFLGTPHRGSEKASYANVLTKVASMATNSPTSKLVSALQSNSDSLMRLTSNFKFQLKNYNVVSFFELRPTKPLSTLIVEKHSALLEVDGEDQIPVDANHSDICKFAARESDTYEKLYKRVLRMLKAEIVAQRNIGT